MVLKKNTKTERYTTFHCEYERAMVLEVTDDVYIIKSHPEIYKTVCIYEYVH